MFEGMFCSVPFLDLKVLVDKGFVFNKGMSRYIRVEELPNELEFVISVRDDDGVAELTIYDKITGQDFKDTLLPLGQDVKNKVWEICDGLRNEGILQFG